MADQSNPTEDLWRSYWLPLLTDQGTHPPSLDRIKGELYDAYQLVDRARAVYHHVTGGACDDLTAPPELVCELADRRAERSGATIPDPLALEGKDDGGG